MTNYGRVRGAVKPQEIEITATSVFLASNITPFEENIDGYTMSGYEYDYIRYDKDEYIQSITAQNAKAITELEDELKAAKILLGVE